MVHVTTRGARLLLPAACNLLQRWSNSSPNKSSVCHHDSGILED